MFHKQIPEMVVEASNKNTTVTIMVMNDTKAAAPPPAAAKAATRSRKILRFAPNEQLTEERSIVHWKDMSRQEMQRVYYSKAEYAAMKEECSKVVALAKWYQRQQRCEVGNTAIVKLNVRGLEHHVCENRSNFRRQRMEMAQRDVFEEQVVASASSPPDSCPDMIAELYANTTAPCRQQAYLRGLYDEREVKRQTDENEVALIEVDDADSFLDALQIRKPQSTTRERSPSTSSLLTASSSLPKIITSPISTLRKKIFNNNKTRQHRSSTTRILQYNKQ